MSMRLGACDSSTSTFAECGLAEMVTVLSAEGRTTTEPNGLRTVTLPPEARGKCRERVWAEAAVPAIHRAARTLPIASFLFMIASGRGGLRRRARGHVVHHRFLLLGA